MDSLGEGPPDENEGVVETEVEMRGAGGGGWDLGGRCPSSETDFLPGLGADEADCFVVLLRRGFNVDDASESSDSSVSLSPLILLELRITNDEGGRRPAGLPGDSPSWLKDGTGEAAALRRAWASRNAATDILWDESDAKLPSRGRGRTGGSMTGGDSLGDSGRTCRKERRLKESESREISGKGADAGGEVGGGGLDFLRSRLAQEKNPPLLFFWGGVRGDRAPTL